MSDEEIEARARELQQTTPPPMGLGTPPPWEILVESSREYWRAKVRVGAG